MDNIESKNILYNYFMKDENKENDLVILEKFKTNMISWYPLKNTDEILEIGGAFGTITKYLCEKVNKVTTIEADKEKIECIENNCRNYHNLEIINEEFLNINIDRKYDYIICFKYLNTKNFNDVLDKCKLLLKEDGKLLLAIDNKFSINNFNCNETELTNEELFSKELLIELLNKNNIKYSKFYNIYPSIDIPNLIVRDDYNLTKEDISRNFRVHSKDEILNFNENDVLECIDIKNLNFFSNSFFIELSFNNFENCDINYVSFTNYRKKEYMIRTIIKKEQVIKQANLKIAQSHIESMRSNNEKFKYKNCRILEKYKNDYFESEFINSKRFDSEYDDPEKCLEELKQILFSESTEYDNTKIINPVIVDFDKNELKGLHFLKYCFLDMIPKNCFKVNNEYLFFDQEWMIEDLPAEYVLYRSIINCFEKDSNTLLEKFGLVKYLNIFEKIEKCFYDKVIDNNIYENIFNRKSQSKLELKLEKDNYRNLYYEKVNEVENIVNDLSEKKVELETKNAELEIKNTQLAEKDRKLVENENKVNDLNILISQKDTHINNLSTELQIIRTSKSWKITKPFRVGVRLYKAIIKKDRRVRDVLFPEGTKVRNGLRNLNISLVKKRDAKEFKKITDSDTAKYWADLKFRLKFNRAKIEQESICNDYMKWILNNEPTIEDLEKQRNKKFDVSPKISIVVPLYNTPIDFFRELLYCVEFQTYSNWELCLADGSPEKLVEIEKMCRKDSRIKYKFLNGNKGISGNTNEALKLATGDYISLLDHDDLLPIFALYEIVKTINENPDAQFIYTDEDKLSNIDDLRYDPYFKCDFAPDTLRSNNYICHYSIFKKELMDEIGGFRSEFDGAQDYDIILRATEKAKKIIHIPKILYHWRVHPASTAMQGDAKPYAFEAGILAIQDHLKRVGLKGTVEHGYTLGTYKVKYDIEGNPKVSIIIPNKDGIDILDVCLKSILDKTTYNNYEIVIVENNSENEETFEFYDKVSKNPKIKVVKYPEKGFNYSKIINFGVKNSDGDFVIQLNNDTELLTPDWLQELIGIAQRKDIGAVGVRLWYPDETIQHAGVIIGIGGVAGHIQKNLPKGQYGYFSKTGMIQNFSAVTAACIISRREIYEDVNYMEEKLAVAFNDVDFCLKIIEKGYLIVYNPFVEFIHYESKTRGFEDNPEKVKRFQGEIKTFQDRWGDFLKKGDPYYNKNLRLDNDQYAIRQDKIDISNIE